MNNDTINNVLRMELENTKRELEYYKSRCDMMYAHKEADVWYWQDDGYDNLDSMINNLTVVIKAGSLKNLVGKKEPVITAEDSLRFNLDYYKDKCEQLEEELRELRPKQKPLNMSASIMFKPIEEVDEKDLPLLKAEDIKIGFTRLYPAGVAMVTKIAVKVTHIPTGVSCECSEYRSEFRNKDVAIHMLRKELYHRGIV